MKDEPLLSPRRLWFATMLYLQLAIDGTYVPLWRMLRFHRRPLAAHRRDRDDD